MKFLAATYKIGYAISFLLIFLGGWVYCVSEDGFFFGVLAGWLPSAIAAAVVSLFWPVIVVVLLVVFRR